MEGTAAEGLGGSDLEEREHGSLDVEGGLGVVLDGAQLGVDVTIVEVEAQRVLLKLLQVVVLLAVRAGDGDTAELEELGAVGLGRELGGGLEGELDAVTSGAGQARRRSALHAVGVGVAFDVRENVVGGSMAVVVATGFTF